MSILENSEQMNNQESMPGAEFEQAQEQRPGFSLNLGFLMAPTGEGNVEQYIDEPLNFDQKKSTARILRGFTGMVGSLNLGIIDVIMGVLEKVREKKQGVE